MIHFARFVFWVASIFDFFSQLTARSDLGLTMAECLPLGASKSSRAHYLRVGAQGGEEQHGAAGEQGTAPLHRSPAWRSPSAGPPRRTTGERRRHADNRVALAAAAAFSTIQTFRRAERVNAFRTGARGSFNAGLRTARFAKLPRAISSPRRTHWAFAPSGVRLTTARMTPTLIWPICIRGNQDRSENIAGWPTQPWCRYYGLPMNTTRAGRPTPRRSEPRFPGDRWPMPAAA